MKKKIGDREYNIIPIPPHLSPYSTLISDLLQTKPKSLQEAEANSREIDQLMEKLLSKTVEPKPPLGDQLAVFNALIDLTNSVIAEAQFFRKNQGSQPAKSGAAQPRSAQTPKRDPETARI